MYDEVIQLTNPKSLMREFSLNESVDYDTELNQLYTEAVFNNGKKQVEPLVEKLQAIKDLLEKGIKDQEESEKERAAAKKERGNRNLPEIKSFNPKSFWRDNLFKELEDEFSRIFGFRDVTIEPYIESYNSSTKMFQSCEMNAFIYHADRFPIEGLVTDKGFYDKSKSTRMHILISLGLLRALEAEELMGVILHEFGHGIDPALVDIKFLETNILSKYLTDRKGAINKDEEKLMKKKSSATSAGTIFGALVILIIIATYVKSFFTWLIEKIKGKERVEREKIDKLRKIIEADKDRFTRQEFKEAFADNFARMYGYGPQLMKGLKKLSKNLNDTIRSRIKKESLRQKIISRITEDCIKDCHKTDIHRARSLIKEYKADIEDKNTPAAVKKQLKEDLKELEIILESYMNDFDDFQNKVNKMINEELEKLEEASNDKETKNINE